MATKVLANVNVEVNDEGFFTNSAIWTVEMANEMAAEIGLTLTPTHIEVLNFLRNRVAAGEALTLRSIGKSGIVDIKGFYGLFPGAPLKVSSKLAGIPKPTSCV